VVQAPQPIGLIMTNARDRQRYAEDPVYRAKRKAKNNEWHAANRDWINEERRKRYATDPDYRAKVRAGNRKKRREHNLRRLYGMSLEDYAVKLGRQGGVCAGCKRKFKKSLCVDHCHTTGLLRGLLCKNCNIGIGYLGDNPYVMRNLAGYVEAWWQRHMKLLGLTALDVAGLASGRIKSNMGKMAGRKASALLKLLGLMAREAARFKSGKVKSNMGKSNRGAVARRKASAAPPGGRRGSVLSGRRRGHSKPSRSDPRKSRPKVSSPVRAAGRRRAPARR
jgi:recombination endonuclease VII